MPNKQAGGAPQLACIFWIRKNYLTTARNQTIHQLTSPYIAQSLLSELYLQDWHHSRCLHLIYVDTSCFQVKVHVWDIHVAFQNIHAQEVVQLSKKTGQRTVESRFDSSNGQCSDFTITSILALQSTQFLQQSVLRSYVLAGIAVGSNAVCSLKVWTHTALRQVGVAAEG